MLPVTVNELTVEYLKKLENEKYYGEVLLKFEAGQITVLKPGQTLKPNDLVNILKIPVEIAVKV